MLRHHSWYSLEDGCREQCSRKSHSPNYIMNPKGVPTKGLWIKVFVKALPIRTAYRPNFELRIRSFKMFSASPAIMNYSILSWLNTSYQFKTPNSDGTPSDTIFAFLMLNTPRSAHKEILGVKFASFERAAIACWYIADYAVRTKSVQWITKPNKHLWVAIVPLLHTNSGTIAIQKRHFYIPIVALLECKRGVSCILWG